MYGGGEESEEAARGMLASLSAFTVKRRIGRARSGAPDGRSCGFPRGRRILRTPIHEAAHSSGAKHRLDRDFHERFRCDVLAIEEATAELTASFVLADLGIAHHPRRDHAAYIASWLEVLKRDPRAIFTAASKAQRAADWLHAQQLNAAQGRDA